jgi:lipoprotein-releasing system permease protein
VIVGARLAQRLRLGVGDRIMLISPRGTATPFGTVPRALAYPIAGTFEVGMFEYDNGYVFMPLETAQKYFMMDDAVTGIEVFVDDPEALEDTKDVIHGVLGGRGRTYDWKQANAQFFGAIQTERNVMFLILMLIILVAAFNIVSSLIMLVKDKGRDIAILRTMGATRGAVMRIFFLTGATIGVVGTFVGFVVGVLFALNIETIRGWMELLLDTTLFPAEVYFLSRLPATLDWEEVGSIVALSFVLSVLATIYPSWRAARLDPVEALRYE